MRLESVSTAPEQFCRGIVRGAQHPHGLLPERLGEGHLVENRVLRPTLGFRQQLTQLLRVLLRGCHLAPHLLEVLPHLGRVETTARRGESASGHLVRLQA